MNRLTYPRKFALISLLFAIPLALLSTFYLAEVNGKIAFAQKEISGTQYLRSLRGLLEHLFQEQLLAQDFAGGDVAARAPLGMAQAQVDIDLQALAALDARLGKRLGTTEQLAWLNEQWATIKARTATMRARASDDLHAKLLGDLRALISTVGDSSNLILDPDLDSYYMMDTVLLKLPEAQTQLARIRQLGARVIGQGSARPEDRSELIILSGLLQTNIADTQKGLGVAFRHTASAQLQPVLEGRLDTYFAATGRFLNSIGRDLVEPRAITANLASHRAAAADALRASFVFWDGATDQLDQLLQARIDGFRQRRSLAVGVTAGVLVLVLIAWLTFYLAVMSTVRALASASERMIRGDMARLVELENRDELGEVVRSFNNVAAALVAANAQQQAVLDNAVDAILTIEDDGRIASINPAAERIFGLSAAELIGRQIARIIPPPYDNEYSQVGVGREVAGLRADGSSFPLDLAIGEMRLADQHRYIAIAHDLTERKRAAEERAHLQERIIRAQAAALAELSTPLIPISDDVVVMPLIGAIDDQRMQQVLAALLSGVERRHARAAILDITGVPIVDSQVATGLVMAAQATRLLGARVILTGIRPEVAQALVDLGVDLSYIVTHSTLQSGIAYATGLGRRAL